MIRTYQLKHTSTGITCNAGELPGIVHDPSPGASTDTGSSSATPHASSEPGCRTGCLCRTFLPAPPSPASVRHVERGYCLHLEPVQVLLTVEPAADGGTARYLSNTTSHPLHWPIPNTSSSYTPPAPLFLSPFFCVDLFALSRLSFFPSPSFSEALSPLFPPTGLSPFVAVHRPVLLPPPEISRKARPGAVH